jgi:UDP-3-O-acyl-N-acetylglucosamine deacetylase
VTGADVNEGPGRLLGGDAAQLRASRAAWAAQPVDLDVPRGESSGHDAGCTTLAGEAAVTGPGTFFGKAQRTLVFAPSARPGWWFNRGDLPEAMPIRVSVNNVWTTARNIVLCSGSPHNYVRMVEHIVALKVGLGLDDVEVRLQSGDPPLFDRGSMDLVEAVETAGIKVGGNPPRLVTVKEPVTMGGPRGSFLTLLPAGESRELYVDCAVDFKSAIGRQRIRFPVTRRRFRHGALARTNTTLAMVLFCKTLGMLFADTRHLGYTMRNILVAGRWRYVNTPLLVHGGKSLEAAWHRAALDLLAALALIDRGRFVGTVHSYKAGHTLDVQMVRELYRLDLLEAV